MKAAPPRPLLLSRRCFAGLLGGWLPGGALLPAQETVLRVTVKLVSLLVSVRNRAGELVGTLEKEDFRIFDNGAPQEIAIFERQSGQPLSVTLLLDTSSSTAIKIRQELESVQRFLKVLVMEGNPQDAAALYTFNDSITLVSGFTRRLERLERALKNIKGSGGTSLYDAMVLAARDLETREGRKVLIVVTDGGDTTSYYTFHHALEAAHLADAVVYPILIVPVRSEAGRNLGGENALTLLAQGTGGKVFRASLGRELDRSFSDLLSELRLQYLLGYYPRNVPLSKDRFHRVRVELSKPELQATTRSGYYGESLDNEGRGFPTRSRPR